MDNKTPNKKNIEKLFSINAHEVLSELNNIEQTGKSSYIPYMIELLLNAESEEVKTKIKSILSQVKHKDAVPELIRGIKDSKYSAIKGALLSCCWQNGLDFSDDIVLFIEIIEKEDYLTAFEASTIIENLPFKVNSNIASIAIQKIDEIMDHVSEEKKQLLSSCSEFIQKNTFTPKSK